jgi:hypothetical protein
MRYWINVVSLCHVRAGMEGGFMQADHGSRSRLERLAPGDSIVFYSPRTELRAGEPVQRFTAAATVLGDAPFEAAAVDEAAPPWRRGVRYLSCEEAPVRPLIEELEFIRDKKSWGVAFRRGFFEIGAGDYERLARAMRVTLAA